MLLTGILVLEMPVDVGPKGTPYCCCILAAGREWRDLSGFCQPGDIFPDHVEFQVDDTTGKDGLDVGMFEGIGDNGHAEFCLLYIKKGQADPIEANGAFFDNKVTEFFGKPEVKFPAAIQVFPFQAISSGIHMSLDNVTVEPAIHYETSFEVDAVSGLPGVEVGLFKGLFYGRNPVVVTPDLFDGKTDAVM